MSYWNSSLHSDWTNVYWYWPVKGRDGTRYERVNLMLTNFQRRAHAGGRARPDVQPAHRPGARRREPGPDERRPRPVPDEGDPDVPGLVRAHAGRSSRRRIPRAGSCPRRRSPDPGRARSPTHGAGAGGGLTCASAWWTPPTRACPPRLGHRRAGRAGGPTCRRRDRSTANQRQRAAGGRDPRDARARRRASTHADRLGGADHARVPGRRALPPVPVPPVGGGRRVLLSVSDEEARAVPDDELPVYTVLVPAYHEPEVIGATPRPPRRGSSTRRQARREAARSRPTTTRRSRRSRASRERAIASRSWSCRRREPRTKPKALNYGLTLATRRVRDDLRRRGPARAAAAPARGGGVPTRPTPTSPACRPSSRTSTPSRT